MGMRMVRGRAFSEQDGANAPLTAIVNEAMLRAYWPSGDPIGKQIRLGRAYGRREMYASADASEVVIAIGGIVADMKQTRDIEDRARAEITCRSRNKPIRLAS
jgi:hypothetical protein